MPFLSLPQHFFQLEFDMAGLSWNEILLFTEVKNNYD